MLCAVISRISRWAEQGLAHPGLAVARLAFRAGWANLLQV